MLLKLKPLNLSTGRPIVILHRDTAKKLGIHVDERVSIRCRKCIRCDKPCKHFGREVIAVVDLARNMLKTTEVAASEEVIKVLGVNTNNIVDVEPALRPLSTNYIQEKLKGRPFSYTEVYSIISDIVKNNLTETEIAYFTAAVGLNNLSTEELISLTKAMIKVGQTIKWNHKYVLDKHCCSGVPGNRTTPIVVSIVGAAIDHLKLDAVMPKTSSRAITSAAGTADVVELLADVEFQVKEFKKILEKVKTCFIWGGILGIAPADDKIIQVERLILLESLEQIVASILAKKIAVGATHVLIDIPYGRTAKFTRKKAKRVKELIKKVAYHFKLKVKCLMTDGNQPIGNGIGAVLEMRDILSVLKNEINRPADLEKKSLMLASELLALTGKISLKEALKLCKFLLYSGKAYNKFKQVILAQGGTTSDKEIAKKLKLARFSKAIRAHKSGKIIEIDNKKIVYLTRVLGCPAEKSAGIYLHKHVGDEVVLGEPLFIMYSETDEKLDFALKVIKHIKPFEIK
jgi:putative thymidine phosphorylase